MWLNTQKVEFFLLFAFKKMGKLKAGGRIQENYVINQHCQIVKAVCCSLLISGKLNIISIILDHHK